MNQLAQIRGMPKLLGQLRRYPRFIEQQATGLLQKNTRLLVSSSGKVPGLVQVTPPHSGGVAGLRAKKQGESAVMGDIWQVYATPAKLYDMIKAYGGAEIAGRYWWLLKNKPERIAQWLDLTAPDAVRRLHKGWDDGAEHMKRRDHYGRVRGRWPSVRISESEIPKLRAYIKRRQKNVGLLAASIPAAYNGRFGPLRGVPAWIGRHRGSWAGGSMTERRSFRRGQVIRISVNAGRLNGQMQRRFNYVHAYRVKAMERETPYIIRYAAKQAGLLS